MIDRGFIRKSRKVDFAIAAPAAGNAIPGPDESEQEDYDMSTTTKWTLKEWV